MKQIKTLKVAIITNYPSPYRIPLFEELSKHINLTVYFTSISKKNGKLKIKDKRRQWNIKDDYNFKYKFLPGFTIPLPGGGNYDVNISILKEIERNKFDAIVLGGYDSFTTQFSFFWSKFRGIPVVLWSGSTFFEDKLVRKLSKPLISYIVRNSNAYIVYGSRAKDYIISLGGYSKKIYIATNVGDVNFFLEKNDLYNSKIEMIKRQYDIESKYNILFVGALSKRKGAKNLINAFKKFKNNNQDWGLILVGNGPEKEHLQEISESVSDIYFYDFVKPTDLPRYYSVADIFILPTSSDPFSIVISEAMASGLPVVSTFKNGASTDLIIDGYNGYVIKDKDPDEIYRIMVEISHNINILRRMGKNSRSMIRDHYNTDNMVKNFLKSIHFVVLNKFRT